MLNKSLPPFITTNGIVFLERTASFLFITYLYQHLTSEDVRLHPNDTQDLLLLFMNGIVFSRIFGGLLTDFLLGTKLALVVGLLLQLLGVFMLNTTNINVIYFGMIPYALGQACIMPAILKRNSMNFTGQNKKLVSINYSTFLSIVLAAVVVSFVPVVREYGQQHSEISAALFIPPLILALILAVLSKGRLGKDTDELEQLERTTPFQPTWSIFLAAVTGIIFLYFAIKAVSLQLNVSDNVYSNLSQLQHNEMIPQIVLFAYIGISVVPALAISIVAYMRTINPALLAGLGFGLAFISVFGMIYLFQNERPDNKFSAIIIFLFFLTEGVIAPAIITLIQRFTPLKYTATALGFCIAFSGFLSGYIAEKFFTTDGLMMYNNSVANKLPALYTSISIFLLFGVVFFLIFLKKKSDKKILRFEDVEDL